MNDDEIDPAKIGLPSLKVSSFSRDKDTLDPLPSSERAVFMSSTMTI
ncbi:MAG: hypothetical protein Q8O89_06765 [Nanoarchaeota archaeon]|nr:hypothetical protein [Nanoarchaeota archaeon]